MKQDNTKKVEALHSSTLRGVAELINSKGIQKEDIIRGGTDLKSLVHCP